MSIETLGRKQKLVRRTWLITPPLLSKLYLPRKASREEQRKKTTQFVKEIHVKCGCGQSKETVIRTDQSLISDGMELEG